MHQKYLQIIDGIFKLRKKKTFQENFVLLNAKVLELKDAVLIVELVRFGKLQPMK